MSREAFEMFIGLDQLQATYDDELGEYAGADGFAVQLAYEAWQRQQERIDELEQELQTCRKAVMAEMSCVDALDEARAQIKKLKQIVEVSQSANMMEFYINSLESVRALNRTLKAELKQLKGNRK